MRLVLETGLALAFLLSPVYSFSPANVLPRSNLPANGTTSSFSNGTTTASRTSSRSTVVSTQPSSSQVSSNGTSSTSRMPLPSLATILTGTVGSQVVTETYVPHIFQDYTTISAEITTTTILTAGGSPVTVVIGPGGIGWAPYHQPSGVPELPPPSSMPPTSVASLDTNFTTKAVSSSSVPKVSSSSTLSASFPSGNSTSSVPHGTGASPPSRPTTSSVAQTSSSASASSTSSGSSSRSSSASQSSGSSSSRSSSISGSAGTKSSSSSSSGAQTSSSSTSHEYIWPVSYVTTAFNNPKESVTTLSVSGSAAIIYSKETFPGLSTITAPATIQTQVVETKTDGSSSTFIGGIVVGPGGVYWGPPGLPPIPPFPGITPPCIWPFCTGGGGGGGSDPPGDPTPPPPYTPDDPNTPDTNSPTSKPTSKPTSTKESTSESKSSSSSSSSSCSVQTKTDFWVSCASGSTSACSTYSTSVVSGCSASAFTTTTASACPLAARVTPDPTMAGFDYSNGEYPIIADDYSFTESFTYTVAQIVSTGVVGAAPTGSVSGSVSQNATSTSSSGSSSSSTKSQGTITTSSSSVSKSQSSTTSSATTTPTRYCLPYADPHNNVKGECQCSSGTAVTKVPLMTSSGDICGYTTYPSPTTTAAPTTTTPAPEWPFTFTDLNYGPIIACKSSSLGNAGGIQYTVCEGDRTTVGTDSSIYSHYTSATYAEAVSSSVSAAAAAASSAAAVPKAACAFSDETLFWTFYVYGIAGSTNWAGDNGDNLHNQENGCGDLTGWSWGKDPNGFMQATFNLPFFMKSGCVERAIASAGGPSGLSCDGDGGGLFKRSLTLDAEQQSVGRRFPTDVELVRERGISEKNQAIQVAKREILSNVKPAAPLTKPKRLTARAELSQLFANEFQLNSRDLEKRGCLDWIWPQKPNIPEKWWCNCVIPGVDECAQAIQKKGVVGNYPSVFYTSWFGVGDGTWGVQGTKNWAKNNICGRFVDWDGIVVGAWMAMVEMAIEKPFGKQGLNWDADKKDEVVDPFLKNLSQAFGEESSGEVYVVMPAGAAFSDKSAWVGYEYPALTRNKKITKIWKVELDTSDPTQLTSLGGIPPFTKTVLWTPDMGPSAQEPKGNRNVALPDQVPQDQIPEQWQQSE